MILGAQAFDSTDCATVGCPNEADTGDRLCSYCRRQEGNVPPGDCKTEGCSRPAPTRGRYAGYCDVHRGRAVRATSRGPENRPLAAVPDPAPRPRSIAEEAFATVQDRMADYGAPADNHSVTSRMWSAYLERRLGVVIALDAEDVCWLNVLQKISRQAHARKRDNTVDVIGFAINADLLDEA